MYASAMSTEQLSNQLAGSAQLRVLARRFLATVLVAFSIGALANVAFEANYEPELRALLVRPSGTLSTVTRTEVGLVRGRYWIASIVHDVAGGGVIVVPDELLITESRFNNLAGLDVQVEDYDSMLTAEMVASLAGLPSVRGVGNITGSADFLPFAVVWDHDGVPIPVLRLWYFEETMFLIDDRVFVSGVD
jgi:hypothetical protein